MVFQSRQSPKEHRDKVLMIDARNIYRKVTRKIYDFSPEQEQNLLAIVWLYRGQTERFLDLVRATAPACWRKPMPVFQMQDDDGKVLSPWRILRGPDGAAGGLQPFLKTLGQEAPRAEVAQELDDAADFHRRYGGISRRPWQRNKRMEAPEDHQRALKEAVERLAPLAETSRDLIKQADLLYKLACRVIEVCEKDCRPGTVTCGLTGRSRGRKAADEARQEAVEQLKQVRYFWRRPIG